MKERELCLGYLSFGMYCEKKRVMLVTLLNELQLREKLKM